MTLLKLGMLNRFKTINEALKMLGGAPATQTANKLSTQTAAEYPKLTDFGGGCKQRVECLADIWDAMIGKVDEINHPLASKLREGDIVFGTNTVKIVFTGGCAMHEESVRENLPLIKELLFTLSGKSITVSIETATATSLSKKELKEKALQNPIVKEALELFEGRIVDVIPINNKGGNDV